RFLIQTNADGRRWWMMAIVAGRFFACASLSVTPKIPAKRNIPGGVVGVAFCDATASASRTRPRNALCTPIRTKKTPTADKTQSKFHIVPQRPHAPAGRVGLERKTVK